MSYSDEEIAALRAALASGVLTVSYEGRSVTYRSVDEIRAALSEIERHRARESGRRLRQVRITSDKGF